MKIDEVIVVEGRDDTNSVRRAVDAETIETHGFGIRPETWELLEKAYRTRGLIVLTDPDHAGEMIRRRILERFPGSKEAFIDRKSAAKGEDIGVENASPEVIREALLKAKAGSSQAAEALFRWEDLVGAGLAGGRGARERREKTGARLGIGYGNARAFLRKLNAYGISREEFREAVRDLDRLQDPVDPADGSGSAR